MGRFSCVTILFPMALCLPMVYPADLPGGFSETLIANTLLSATSMAIAPDGRVFVCQQGGQLRVIKQGVLLSAPFAQFSVHAVGERGLLGVAFDPAFASNGFVYVYYTVSTLPYHNRLSRVRANGDVMLTGSETVLVEFENLSGATNHNGGALNFGTDGKLYVALGDNANGANAQSMSSRLGKLLRLNSDGSIPTDNPFYNSATGVYRSIWVLGLRNPFTFAFQPGTGRIFINDVGESRFEEINDGIAGSNYGWPATEGETTNPQYRGPLYVYPHGAGNTSGCAITGGAFYNPASVNFPSEYVGSYFYAEYCNGWIARYNPATDTSIPFATGIAAPVDLRVSADGRLYYLARGAGAVYRIDSATNIPPTITSQPLDRTAALGQSVQFSVAASGSAPLRYQWFQNGLQIPGATAATYSIASITAALNGYRFHVRVSNDVGSVTSNVAFLTVTPNQAPTATITAPVAGALYSAGTIINYSGTAIDREDGTLPASAFTWRVDFHHDTHTHPFLPSTTGARSGSVSIPNSGETSANVWYRFYLTVRDSAGLTTTVFRDVYPRKVTLTFQSVPPGLQIAYQGQPRATPYSVEAVVGLLTSIGTAQIQQAGGVYYEFVSWATGAAREYTIPAPGVNTTYTATFRVTSAVGISGYLSDRTPLSAASGWGPYERDRSNGDSAPGDGRILTMNGVKYPKGLGTHANAELRYSIGGCSAFQASIGVDDAVGSLGSVVFEVWGDGVQLFNSGRMTGGSAARDIDVNIAGRIELRLIVRDGGDGINYDHADWANARFVCARSEFLSDMTPTVAINGFGPYERDRSNAYQGADDGRPLRIDGTLYAKGLGTHATSELRYSLAGRCTLFESQVGVDDEVGTTLASVVFQVWGDSTLLYDSGLMRGFQPAKAVSVNLTGRTQLILRVLDGGDGINFDHADWGNARISCSP